MTVRELINWLEDQDQEAIIQVVAHKSGTGYYDQGGTASEEDFTLDLSDYTDFRGNPFTGPDSPFYNQRFLLLGELDG